MWNLKNQNRIRWLSTLLIFFAAIYILWQLKNTDAGFFSSTGLKIKLTILSIKGENFPWWYPAAAICVNFILVFIGVPSIWPVGIMMLFFNPFYAFLIIFVSQLSASFLILKIGKFHEKIFKLSEEVGHFINRSELTTRELTFWPRLFVLFPLRTLDLILAYKILEETGRMRIYFNLICTTALRTGLTSLWICELVNVLVDFRPFPEKDLVYFLTSSAIFVLSAIWPKIPELNFLSEPMGKSILEMAEES